MILPTVIVGVDVGKNAAFATFCFIAKRVNGYSRKGVG